MKISKRTKEKLLSSINKEIWAIIPARSGSMRVKNKNLQKINGKELISYSILLSKKIKLIDKTFVSTNCNLIAKKSINYGADCPFLRPSNISGKNSTDTSYILHFLKTMFSLQKKLPSILVQLRPTSPFRSRDIVSDAILKFKRKYKHFDSLRSSNIMSHPPEKSFRIKGGKYVSINLDEIDGEYSNRSSQLFQKTYKPNGYVDIIKTQQVISSNNIYGKSILPFITSQIIEIDCLNDLQLARNDNSKEKKYLVKAIGSKNA